MVITELFPDGNSAIGRFGSGLLVLSKRNDHPYLSHILEYADDMLLSRALFIQCQKEICKRTGLVYLTANLGAVPLCLETTYEDTILVRVGYRNDYKHKFRNYRPEMYPHPRIVLS